MSLTAGRINARRDWTLADHVDQVRAMQTAHRLEAGVEASLRLSYADVGERDRRLLRLLSQLPVSAFDENLAGALTDRAVSPTRTTIERLAGASWVHPLGDGRYGLHDVVRLFLAGRSLEEDPPRVREQALDRLIDYQIAATAAARALYAPQLQPPTDLPPVAVPTFTDRSEAATWLERERPDLLAGAASALNRGGSSAPCRCRCCCSTSWCSTRTSTTLTGSMRGSPSPRPVPTGRAPCWRSARSTAPPAGWTGSGHRSRRPWRCTRSSETMRASARRCTTWALCAGLGDYQAAVDYYRRALDLASQVEGPSGVALTVDNLGMLYARLGRDVEAEQCHETALKIHRRLDDRLRAGRTLGDLGVLKTRAGELEQARALLEQALATSLDVSDQIGEITAVSRLAEVDSLAGRHDAAIEGQRHAVDLVRARSGTTEGAAEVLVGLAAAYRRSGRSAEAELARTDAVAAARAAGDPYWIARAAAEGATLGEAGHD